MTSSGTGDRTHPKALRILVVQETDWVDRNPILHHRMLEAMSIGGDEITVLDHEIFWGRGGRFPLWRRRRVWTEHSKILPGSRITVIRPGMLRIPGIARVSWLITTWFELRRYIRAGRPDAIVAYGISNSYLARILARRHGIPFVFHIFDSLHALAEPAVLRPLAALVERHVLRAADRIVVPYRALLGYLARRGVRADRVELIPNGMTHRTLDSSIRAEVRQRLGIADDEVALLFIGWLYRHSGLDELARQLARSETARARYRLVIVGDGDLAGPLARIRDETGLGDRLILTGRRPVSEMAHFVAGADVCLLPSTQSAAMRYIVPTKVDEYLELARPVMSSRLEGMLAEFRDMAGIIWVDGPTDVLPTLDRLLFGDRPAAEVLAELSRASAGYAAGREDWPTVIDRFRTVIADAAEAAGGARKGRRAHDPVSLA
jgi:glycosyltransferase involved in cell wall biosynthesis